MNNETLAQVAQTNIKGSSGSLQDFQLTHLGLFKQKGLTTSVPEYYKFTNLSKFMESQPEISNSEPVKVDLGTLNKAETFNVIFVDGKIQPFETPEKGLVIKTIEEAFGSISHALISNNALTHLHHSLLGSGVVLELEKKAVLKKPIRITHVVTKSDIVAPTLIIQAHAFSSASIMEEVLDHGLAYSFISESYAFLAEGAHIEHIQVGQGSAESFSHTTTTAHVGRDADYKNFLLNLSGKLNRRNLVMEMKDSGANGESYNLFLTHQTEHSDIQSQIEHKAADTTSKQMAKGILDGESKGIFTGKIHIHPQAQRVNSSQLNKNLLLSKKAQVHSQPQLEIFADDVKCAHGSTTGQLSDDEVFYFEARGIPANKARTLLAHGFGLEIVLKIKNPVLQKIAGDLVMEGLKGKFQLEASL